MPGKARFCYAYPRPMVTVDCVVLRVHARRLEVLLVRRRNAPSKGRWALPGGFIKMSEPLDAAARRELAEETGITKLSYLAQLGAYGDPKRDPRGRVISVGHMAILAGPGKNPAAGDDAREAQWHPVESLPGPLAFDHAAMLADALRRLSAPGVAFAFLPRQFTARQLSDVLQAVHGARLSPKQDSR